MTPREAFETWWSLPVEEWSARHHQEPEITAWQAWAAATLAERERAAKVCDQADKSTPPADLARKA